MRRFLLSLALPVAIAGSPEMASDFSFSPDNPPGGYLAGIFDDINDEIIDIIGPGTMESVGRENQQNPQPQEVYTRRRYWAWTVIAWNQRTGFWARAIGYPTEDSAYRAAMNSCEGKCDYWAPVNNDEGLYVGLYRNGATGDLYVRSFDRYTGHSFLTGGSSGGGGNDIQVMPTRHEALFVVRNIPQPNFRWNYSNYIVESGDYDPYFDYYFEGRYLGNDN